MKRLGQWQAVLFWLLLLPSCGVHFGALDVTYVRKPVAAELAISGAGALVAGACAEYSVLSADSSGKAVNQTADLALALSNDGAGAFFSDSACSLPIYAVTIPRGTSSGSFFFSDTRAESTNLIASVSGLRSAALAVSVHSGDGTVLAIVDGPVKLLTGNCAPYRIETQDLYANSSAVARPISITLTGNGYGSFYQDALCQTPITTSSIDAGQDSVTVYFNDASVESLTLTASAVGFQTGKLGITTVINGGGLLAFTAGVSSLSTNNCALYTVTTENAATGAPAEVAGALVVTLSGNGPGQFYSDSACSAPVSELMIDAAKTGTSLYFLSPGVASSLMLRASAANYGPALFGVNVVASQLPAGPPPDPTGITATATNSSQIQLNWSSAAGTAVGYEIAYKPGAAPPSNCSQGFNVGNVSSYGVTHLSAGVQYSFRLCAYDSSTPPQFSSGVTATATTFSPPPNPTTLSANGLSPSQILLSWTSAPGAAGYRLAYAAGLTAPADCNTSSDLGNITSATISSLAPGTLYSFRVCSYDNHSPPNLSGGVIVTGGTVSAAQSTVSASPSIIIANGLTTSTIVVTINDAAGNPISGKSISLAAGSGSSAITVVSATTNGAGQGTFTVKDAVVETVTYSAQDVTDGVTVTQTASVNFAALVLYITDNGDQRIRMVVGDPGNISTVSGNGSAGYTGDNGSATSAELNYPTGVGVDASGNLFIADYANNRIRKVTPGGVITTVAGNGSVGSVGDNGPAISAELDDPVAVAVDNSGNLYIADYGNDRIRKVSSSGTITTVAGGGSSGLGDGGPATTAQLDSPCGLAFDGAGNLFIADYGSNRIRKVSSGGTITTVAGNGLAGFAGDSGPATSAELDGPIAVTVDNSGNLYVADMSNNRIRKITSGGTITTVAGGGNSGLGDGGQSTSAQLDSPYSVTLDGPGNLYIADYGHNRIRKVSPGAIISTMAGGGSSGLGDNGPATAAELNYPTGVVSFGPVGTGP